jgi:hypothetical protein
MGVGQWMRVVDTISNLAQFAERFRARPPGPGEAPTVGASGGLEARLAGVVVAALKEAFDRDRQRMDLERDQIEAERRRAEQALRAELRRQAAERAAGQLRLIAIIAVGVWMLSAGLGAWLEGMRSGVPRALLAAGWACAFASIGCAFAGWQHTSDWTMDEETPRRSAPAVAAPWMLLAGLTLVGGSLLVAL